jgi:competence ComEA-like helix-hairpin-helix protein
MAKRLNINNASAEEISNSIEGIGPETAQLIVNYRESNGNINKIKGIDDTMIDKIRNRSDIQSRSSESRSEDRGTEKRRSGREGSERKWKRKRTM